MFFKKSCALHGTKLALPHREVNEFKSVSTLPRFYCYWQNTQCRI